uniref:Transcription factor MYC/MYB N-terminal domain-containing protein n=1 Tax=Oryza barthii TaxID=65489 RepID=A0A0D3HLF9_9ORYZ
MVGSGAAGGGGGGGGGGDHARSKEAAGMMALHEALRNVCLNSDWTYSVFWTIRPRPRCRGGNGCKVGDDNGSLMLMWEDGFCRPRVAECLEDIDGEDPVRKAFSKMSIQLYNYGEGLMGKVASDKCHKWVFKEPSECEPNITNYWQSSFDATIAVIQAGHGLLQLGSCKIIPEDLHFVLRMRHMFESLGYQSGFFLSQLFSSSRGTSPSPSSLESHSNKARRMESAQSTKFKRSFTLPARMSSSTTSTSPSVSASTAPAPPQQQQGMEYRGPHEGGVYSDLMETFLE